VLQRRAAQTVGALATAGARRAPDGAQRARPRGARRAARGRTC
jgi:hypothetical protein